jgi:hypothetical protein
MFRRALKNLARLEEKRQDGKCSSLVRCTRQDFASNETLQSYEDIVWGQSCRTQFPVPRSECRCDAIIPGLIGKAAQVFPNDFGSGHPSLQQDTSGLRELVVLELSGGYDPDIRHKWFWLESDVFQQPLDIPKPQFDDVLLARSPPNQRSHVDLG